MLRSSGRAWAALLLLVVFCAGCGITNTVKRVWDSEDSNLRKRVVVTPFAVGVPNMESDADTLAAAVQLGLEQTGNMVLIDSSKLFQATVAVDRSVRVSQDRLLLAARTLGLNTVVSGAVVGLEVKRELTGIYGFRDNEPFLMLSVNIKLLDVASGALLGDKSFVVRKALDEVQASNLRLGAKIPPELIAPLMKEMEEPLVEWIVDQIGTQKWAGYVQEVQGDRYKVSVGRGTGLPEGATLVAYSRGGQIRCGAGYEVCLPGPKVAMLRLVEMGPMSSWAEQVPGEDEDGNPTKSEVVPGMLLRTR